MPKPFQIRVFGKAGCDKCRTLEQRLDRMLECEEWAAFERAYRDLLTEEGLVDFCEADGINPQRIPALLVCRWNAERGDYEPVANPNPGAPDPDCGRARLYAHVGLQTDYSAEGGGVVSPKMIAAVLRAAVAAVAPAAAAA
jgi:hypothetical protein